MATKDLPLSSWNGQGTIVFDLKKNKNMSAQLKNKNDKNG